MDTKNTDGYVLTSCTGRGQLFCKPTAKVINPTVVGIAYIDDWTRLNYNCNLMGGVTYIGKYCSIAPEVTFQSIGHNTRQPSISGYFYKENFDTLLLGRPEKPIQIENDVWIGTRAIILSGVTIGNGAIIGAGAVVTKDVEPYSISVGNPAQHKKWRFPENIRKQLLEIKWWDWSMEKIRKNNKFFGINLDEVDDIYKLIV